MDYASPGDYLTMEHLDHTNKSSCGSSFNTATHSCQFIVIFSSSICTDSKIPKMLQYSPSPPLLSLDALDNSNGSNNDDDVYNNVT